MAYETLVAVYDTPPHAEAAVKALKAAGFADSDISVFDLDSSSGRSNQFVPGGSGSWVVASPIRHRCS